MFLNQLKPLIFQENEIIYQKGYSSTGVYILYLGMVMDVMSGRMMMPGNMFGEQEIIFKTNRMQSIKAVTQPVITYYFQKDVFEQILKEFPYLQDEVNTKIRTKEEYKTIEKLNQKMVKDNSILENL